MIARIDKIYLKPISERIIIKDQLKNEFMYGNIDRFMEGQFSSVIPDIKIEYLEQILNGFIKKGIEEKERLTPEAGLVISYLANETFKRYIKEEEAKGVKPEDIKSVQIKLDTRELKEPLSFLGRKIPEKLRLIIDGNAGNSVGEKSDGGQVIVDGNTGNGTGLEMEKGLIVVKGNAGDGTGEGMKSGKILIEKDCGERTGCDMTGGELDIVGKVEEFFLSSTLARNITENFPHLLFQKKTGVKLHIWEEKSLKTGKKLSQSNFLKLFTRDEKITACYF